MLRPEPRSLLAAALVIAVACALALLPPLVALWVVGGAALVAVVLIHPIVGLYLLPMFVAFGSEVELDVHGIHVGPTDLLVAALVLAWGIRRAPRVWRRRRDISSTSILHSVASLRALWRRHPAQVALVAALVAYLAVVVLSLSVATERITALKEILKWSEVIAVMGVGVWLLRDLRAVRLAAWSIIAAGVAQALFGLGQWALAAADARVLGTFAQPNPYAGYLNFALPLAIALVLFGPDVRERWAAGAAAAVLVAGEYVAWSRGATLAILAALVVIAVVAWRRERLVGWIAGVGATLAAVAWVARLIPASLQQRLLDQVRLDNAAVCGSVNDANFSTMERLAHWAAGLRMFAAHPLLGVGAGNYTAGYAAVAAPCWPNALGHAHNYYITAAAETGVLGLLAFLALTGASLLVAGLAARGDRGAYIDAGGQSARDSIAADHATAVARSGAYPSTLGRTLALGFLGVLVALAVHNLFDDLFVHAMELQVALCLAVALRLSVLPRRAT